MVQLTPPGSPCSIHFGKGVTTAVPGSAQGLFLVVVRHRGRTRRAHRTRRRRQRGRSTSTAIHGDHRAAGPATRTVSSYGSYASFSDPDGNSWLLQEVKTRLPGRGLSTGRRDADRASARDRGAPWRVRTDRSEAPLVGVVRRLHRRARAREDSRRGSERCRAPHGRPRRVQA